MNTNEFYKELMSEYSFNHEKIKKAAMGKIEKNTVKHGNAKWIALSTAAVVTLAVGTVGAVSIFSGRGGTPVTVSTTASMTVEERIRLALEAYESADEENSEDAFFYVTFSKSVTPEEMKSALASVDNTGKIRVISVYFADGNSVSGGGDIKQLFEAENSVNIVAAKIICPANLLKAISDLKQVYIVENCDTIKDFSIIKPEKQEQEPSSEPESVVSSDESEYIPPKEESSEQQEESSSVTVGESARDVKFLSDSIAVAFYDNKISLIYAGEEAEIQKSADFELENALPVYMADGYMVVGGADYIAEIKLGENAEAEIMKYSCEVTPETLIYNNNLVFSDATNIYMLADGEVKEIAEAAVLVSFDGATVAYSTADSIGFYNMESGETDVVCGTLCAENNGYFVISSVDEENTPVNFIYNSADATQKQLDFSAFDGEEAVAITAISADGRYIAVSESYYEVGEDGITKLEEKPEATFTSEVAVPFESGLFTAEISDGNIVINVKR